MLRVFVQITFLFEARHRQFGIVFQGVLAATLNSSRSICRENYLELPVRIKSRFESK